MKMYLQMALFVPLLLCATLPCVYGQDDLQVLSSDDAPKEMMTNWLRARVDERLAERSQKLENLNTSEQIESYQENLRREFIERIGGFPERTPLNTEITGRIQRQGYRVEKVVFESLPGFYVTGALFLPESPEFQGPFPASLVVCGHSAQAKAYEAYQTACALAALNGIAAFIIDPVGQGERYQHLDEQGNIELPSTTTGHSLLGVGSILLGENTARFEIWDGMRAIDYLQSREDIDGARIGCMGNSGGGTQTAYLMALEPRIKAAAPACYITNFDRLLATIGPQDAEQNIFGQLEIGLDHGDYLMLQAPTPILICCATKDFFDIDGTWQSFREAKRLYGTLGFPERISLVETNATHGWSQPLRIAAVQWMVRWLDGRDIVVEEPAIELIPEKELWAISSGQTLHVEGARSAFDVNSTTEAALQESRAQRLVENENIAAAIRTVTGVAELDGLRDLEVHILEQIEQSDAMCLKLQFRRDHGVMIPGLLFRPLTVEEPSPWLIGLHQDGMKSLVEDGEVDRWVAQGRHVLLLDLRGIGETSPNDAVWYDKRFGNDAKHLVTAYLLGQSYVQMRTEDLLTIVQWVSQQDDAASGPVDLDATGHLGTVALHAAALEEQLFNAITVRQSLESWQLLVNSKYSKDAFAHVIHGALRHYDLPDLRQSLGKKLTWLDPVDALGTPMR